MVLNRSEVKCYARELEMTRSKAYSFLKERVEMEFRQLENDKVTPWVFFRSGKELRLTDFFGKTVSYSGIVFEGSPRTVFWKDFIQPFFQDIISRSFSETRDFCLTHGLEQTQPMEETASLLKAGIKGIYQRMSEIDQVLRGNGIPSSVPKYEASSERADSEEFVEERLLAELALARSTIEVKQERKNMLKQDANSLVIEDVWKAIEAEYDESKRSFAKKINFVKDKFKRKVIFRDVEQAFLLAHQGFSKSSVVLAGGVIEELLRLYLESKNIRATKNNLDSYIKTCEDRGLLKSAIHKLADSIRQFRNIVHLERENSPKYSISKATAKGAVSSIFTITNDFDA